MNLWLRVRGVPIIAGALLVIGILHLGIGNALLAVPIFTGSYGTNGWITPLVIALGIVIGSTFLSKTTSIEVRTCLRVAILDCALFLVLIFIGFIILLAGSKFGDSTLTATALLGKVLAAAGIASVGILRLGTGGVLITTAAGILSVGYGYDAPGGRYVRVFAIDGDPAMGFIVGGTLIGYSILIILLRNVRTNEVSSPG